MGFFSPLPSGRLNVCLSSPHRACKKQGRPPLVLPCPLPGSLLLPISYRSPSSPDRFPFSSPPLPSPSERAFISYRKRFLGLREEGEGRARKIEGPPRLHFRNRNLKSLFLVGLSPDFPLNADVKFVPGWHHPNPEGKDVEHYSKVIGFGGGGGGGSRQAEKT